MNKMAKKLLSGFMAFAMVFTMLPVSVFAETGDTAVTPPADTELTTDSEQPGTSSDNTPNGGTEEGEGDDSSTGGSTTPAEDGNGTTPDNSSDGGTNASEGGNDAAEEKSNAEALAQIAELQAQADALTAESENLQASCKAIYDELMAVYDANREDAEVYQAVGGVMSRLGELGFDPYAVMEAATEEKSVSFEVVWADGEPEDVDSITVTLQQTVDFQGISIGETEVPQDIVDKIEESIQVPTGETISITLTESNDWEQDVTLVTGTEEKSGTYTYEKTINVPIFGEQKISIDVPYTYSYEYSYGYPEVSLEGYTASISGDADKGYVITLTSLTDIDGFVAWYDGNSETRPDFTVTLTATDDADVTYSATITGEAEEFVITGVDATHEYDITVSKLNGYKTTNSGITEILGTKTLTIRNTLQTDVTVQKVWADAKSSHNPVTISLKTGKDTIGTAELSEGKWSETFTVDAYDKYYQEIEYYAEEVSVEGYSSNEAAIDENGKIVVTNIELMNLSGSISWNDANDQDGDRPASVEVTITGKVGENTVHSGTATAQKTDWGYSLTVPKYHVSADSTISAITYTVTPTVPETHTWEENAAASVTNGVTGTITLVDEIDTVDVSAGINWLDDGNADKKRPTEVQVRLYADNAVSGSVITLNAENNWSYTWVNQTKNKSKESASDTTVAVDYSVEVVGTVDKYAASVSEQENVNTITMLLSETTNITGKITWNGGENDLPEEVIITLNTPESKETATATATTGWRYTFEDKAVYDNQGKKITYTITAPDLESWVDKTVTGYDVSYKYSPGNTEVSAEIVWSDAENQDGKRPTSVTVKLLANGVELTDKVATLQEDDGKWKQVWLIPSKDAEGTTIQYSITVEAVDGYTVTISEGNSPYTITLTHEPEPIDISGTITWDDANNQDGIRPSAYSVSIVGKVGDDVVVAEQTVPVGVANGSNNWALENQPKYNNGSEIQYVVTPAELDGYEVKNDEKAQTLNAYILTHTPAAINISGSIIWDDFDDAFGTRPDSVTVTLSNEATAVASAETEWKYSFTDLDKYSNGEEIKYTVSAECDGYDMPASALPEDVGEYDILLVMKYKTIPLYVLGDYTGEQTVTLNKDGTVVATFDDMAKVPESFHAEGYEVVAEKVEGYYTEARLIPDVKLPLSVLTDALGLTIDNIKSLVNLGIFESIAEKVITEALKTEVRASALLTMLDNEEITVREQTISIPAALKPMIKSAREAVIEAAASSTETADNYIAVVTNTLNSVDVDILTVWVDNNDREGNRPGMVTFNGDSNKSISGTYASRGNVWYAENAFVVDLLKDDGEPVNHMYSITADREDLEDNYMVNDIAIPLVLDASLLAALPMDDLAAAVEKIQNELETLDPEQITPEWLTNAIQTVMAYDMTIGGYSVEDLMNKVMDKLEAEGLKETIKAVANKAWDYAMSKDLVPSKWIVVNMNTYIGEVTAEVDYIVLWNDYDYSSKRPETTTIKVESEKADAKADSVEEVLNKNNYSGYIWFQPTTDRIAYADANDLTSTGWNIHVETSDEYESLALAFPIVLTEDGEATSNPDSATSSVELANLLKEIKANLSSATSDEAWASIKQAITDYVSVPSLENLKAALEALSGNLEAGALENILDDLKNVAQSAFDVLEGVPTIDVRLVVVVLNTYVGERYAEVDYITIWNDYDYEDKRPSPVTVTVTSKLEGAAYGEASEQVSGSGYIWYNSTDDKIGFKELDQLTSTGYNIKVNGADNIENYITHKMAFPVVLTEESSDFDSIYPTVSKEELADLLDSVQENLKDGVTQEDWTKLENTIKEYAEMPNLDKLQAVLEGLYQNVEEGQYSVVIGKVAVLSSKLIDELKNLPDMDVRLVVVVLNTYVGERQVKVDVLKIWNDNNNEDENRPDAVAYSVTYEQNGNEVEMSAAVSGNINNGVVRYAPGAFTVPYETLNAVEDLSKVQVYEEISESSNPAMVDNYIASDVVMIPMLVPEIGETSFDYEFQLPADAQARVDALIAEVEGEAKTLIKEAYESIKANPTIQNLQDVLTNLTTKAEDALTTDNLLKFVEAVAGVSEDELKAVFEELKNSEAAQIAGAIATLLGADEAALEEFVNTLPSEVKGKVQEVLD